MSCGECNGKGFITQTDYNHDVVMKIQCPSCLHEAKFLQELEMQIRVVLRNTSHEKMIEVVSSAIIKTNQDSTDRLETLVHSKNIPALLAYV
tara:strand:- start:5167 stop:5442 length:276 start_codon:yes stop_codon:yes gene_type:complete